jgi:hypothetical protein
MLRSSKLKKDSSVDKLNDEFIVFFHEPVPSIKSVSFTIGTLFQVVHPFGSVELERLFLCV